MENGVKTNVLEIGNGFHFAQVIAITFAQTKDGAAGAEHLFPEMRERMGRRLGVHLDHFDRLAVLRIRRANTCEGEKYSKHAYVKKLFFHARFHHESDFAAAGELGVAMRASFPHLGLEHKPSWEFNPGEI